MAAGLFLFSGLPIGSPRLLETVPRMLIVVHYDGVAMFPALLDH